MTTASFDAAVGLPARRGGAKALLLTVLGEFVLPAGGSVWTSSLVAAGEALGIGEKNARQAISRIADQGLVISRRHGRQVRWSLTDGGRRLLESGAARIYEFGTSTAGWDGEWLVAHCSVPESQRALRRELRTSLAFLGFGELSASLAISPHADREGRLRATLDELGLLSESVVLRSRTGSIADDADLVARAWALDELGDAYRNFRETFVGRRPADAPSAFRATVELVDDWRRFPFTDPELPGELLPSDWEGAAAAEMFHDRHARWRDTARAWFSAHEEPRRSAS